MYKLFTQLLYYTIIFDLMLLKKTFLSKIISNLKNYLLIHYPKLVISKLHKCWTLKKACTNFEIWHFSWWTKTISCNFSKNWFLYSYCTRRLSLKCKKLKTFKVDQKYSSQKTRNHLRRRNKMKMKNISKKWNIIFCGKHLLCRCLFVNNAWFYPRFLPWFNWFGIFGNRRYIYYPFNIVIYACFSRNKTVKSLPA